MERSQVSSLKARIQFINFIVIFLIVISSSFLFIASSSKKEALPPWMGITDAILAFLVIGLSFYVYLLAGKVNKATRWVISCDHLMKSFQIIGVFTSCIFYFVWMKRADFDLNILLPGFAQCIL